MLLSLNKYVCWSNFSHWPMYICLPILYILASYMVKRSKNILIMFKKTIKCDQARKNGYPWGNWWTISHQKSTVYLLIACVNHSMMPIGQPTLHVLVRLIRNVCFQKTVPLLSTSSTEMRTVPSTTHATPLAVWNSCRNNWQCSILYYIT